MRVQYYSEDSRLRGRTGSVAKCANLDDIQVSHESSCSSNGDVKS